MKVCQTEQEYLDQIIEPVRRCCKRYGYLPSVLIAQSCLENGYGIRSYWDNPQIEALMTHNNMVGIKVELLSDSWTACGLSVWPGKSLEKKTPEVYNGVPVTINADFRKYDSIEQSFADFLCFFTWGSDYGPGGTPKYGAEVLHKIKDPEKLIKKVKALGYATDPKYPDSVMSIVRKHNLTKYDNLTGVTSTDYVPKAAMYLFKKEEIKMNNISINRQYITTNNTNSTNQPIAIVIHNTDNFSKGANARAHAVGLYNGDMVNMSWHYVVDDHEIYQCINHDRGAWHVGKNYGRNNLFGVIHNRNSICIEICVNEGIDYEASFKNAVALTKYLMKELGIPYTRVYSHYDICSKDCPSQIRKHGDWDRFKRLIASDNDETKGDYVVNFGLIHLNSTGPDVGTLQVLLNGYGCKGKDGKQLTVDKHFGENTEYALKTFQEAHGLEPDGWCGVLTWPKLFMR